MEHQIEDYEEQLKKAKSRAVDQQSYEARRFTVRVLIVILAVVGLAIDATTIVQNFADAPQPGSWSVLPSSLYFTVSAAALRTLIVMLSMLNLRLPEFHRLSYISLLGFLYLLALLLICLFDYKNEQPLIGAHRSTALYATNVISTTVLFFLSFATPTGPTMYVESVGSLPARNVIRYTVGGGCVVQILFGLSTFPVVRSAYKNNKVVEDDVPALDYEYRSAVIADDVIRRYRESYHESLRKTPSSAARTDVVKARALLMAIVRCNASQLKTTAVVLCITTVSFYIPKLGLGLVLDGLEKYENSLSKGNKVDTIEN